MSRRRTGRHYPERKLMKLQPKMKKHLMWCFLIVMLCMLGIIIRVIWIESKEQEDYARKLLEIKHYDSVEIPARRGKIYDRNGKLLAKSEKVYSVILDCDLVETVTEAATEDSEEKRDYREPTIEAMVAYLHIDRQKIEQALTEKPESKYFVIATGLSVDDRQAFLDYCSTEELELKKEWTEAEEELYKKKKNVKGVWFETHYERRYPYKTLASQMIGFVRSDGSADYGLEGYYNTMLSGVSGRRYGFLSEGGAEAKFIEQTDGQSIVTSLDSRIQKIAQRQIDKFNEKYRNHAREGDGSANTGVVVMDPNSGEILAMASNRTYDPNDPRDMSPLYTEEQFSGLPDKEQVRLLAEKWSNYCISNEYEPGSTAKTFTIASALESGNVPLDKSYECKGFYEVNGKHINCHGTHHIVTMEEAVTYSCNAALMQMSFLIGKDYFCKYQSIFNFGRTTGVDLMNETTGTVYESEKMDKLSLATNSFGQNYTVSMLQTAAAFSSVVNGGYYYRPHLVTATIDADGNTTAQEPLLMKQTVSASTSARMRKFLKTVVDKGTGKRAKVKGYSMIGKTGTAEKVGRNKEDYLVSFIGAFPADEPEIVIYVVVDEPNVEYEDDSSYAQDIYRKVMEKILKYKNIKPDEKQKAKE